LWDPTTGRQLWWYPAAHRSTIYALATTATGLASVGADGTIGQITVPRDAPDLARAAELAACVPQPGQPVNGKCR